MSIDKFYELVTGEQDAFYKMCMVLPNAIKNLLETSAAVALPKDTVFDELKNLSTNSFELALYILGFETYAGFNEI